MAAGTRVLRAGWLAYEPGAWRVRGHVNICVLYCALKMCPEGINNKNGQNNAAVKNEPLLVGSPANEPHHGLGDAEGGSGVEETSMGRLHGVLLGAQVSKRAAANVDVFFQARGGVVQDGVLAARVHFVRGQERLGCLVALHGQAAAAFGRGPEELGALLPCLLEHCDGVHGVAGAYGVVVLLLERGELVPECGQVGVDHFHLSTCGA